MSNHSVVSKEVIVEKIHEVRGQQVMLDSDLAELYDVETKYLKRQVRRNINRFLADFMFELTKDELEVLRSQFGTSSWGGARYVPMAFTEQGVAQLSGVLSSQRAIEVNIEIIRLFTRMRKLLMTHKDLLLKMEAIEKKVTGHDQKIEAVFQYLKQFIKQQESPRKEIGYKKTIK